MSMTETPPAAPPESDGPFLSQDRPTAGQDRLFEGITTGAGILILLTLAGVAFFLAQKSLPALDLPASSLPNAESLSGYILPLLFGTIWASIIALLLAMPLAVAVALFMTHYAPPALARALGWVIDLLAAVPSVVYGLWGIFVLAPFFVPVYRFLADTVGWFPLFQPTVTPSGRNMASAALVLAVMILPIIASVSKEVFLQTPRLHEEAAMALGATRWEVIKTAVLPHGRSGVIGGAMLGLGRALGETMAIALVLSPAPGLIGFALFTSQNPSTIAANIALSFPNFGGQERSALFATGLVLFIGTFLVNYIARRIAGEIAGF